MYIAIQCQNHKLTLNIVPKLNIFFFHNYFVETISTNYHITIAE